ncbi:carbon starvation protein A, partial [Candidatus Poribacteria bacterium]|nr:carbon starvation protein A [Candidatus Poribacteria bacterium]
MSSLLVAALAFVAYIVAYHTYGKFLARKVFGIDPARVTPAHTLKDGTDYVPTKREVLLGHHFTSIAGTGPIVGPAIAIIWGWVPALLWVVFGSIFIGAVHDFGALVLSVRHRGTSIGDLAGTLVNPRV